MSLLFLLFIFAARRLILISASRLSTIYLSIFDNIDSNVYSANIFASIIDDSTDNFMSDLILFNFSVSGKLYVNI